MPLREFRPGVRFSVFDAILLSAGAIGSRIAWAQTWWLGFVIGFVVCHFFLFCNVFRISRLLELIWAAIFVTLTRFTVATGSPGWAVTITVSLAASLVVLEVELRKPSYHGVGWSRINPKLRDWWDASCR